MIPRSPHLQAMAAPDRREVRGDRTPVLRLRLASTHVRRARSHQILEHSIRPRKRRSVRSRILPAAAGRSCQEFWLHRLRFCDLKRYRDSRRGPQTNEHDGVRAGSPMLVLWNPNTQCAQDMQEHRPRLLPLHAASVTELQADSILGGCNSVCNTTQYCSVFSCSARSCSAVASGASKSNCRRMA